MAYTSNPNLPKVRMQAVRLVKQGWTTRKVALHFGYSHSSVVRWTQRVKAEPGAWNKHIQTKSSRPKSHPRALAPEIVAAIIAERLKRSRCAEIVYEDLKAQGVKVSLSSVKRTLVRHELVRPKSKWKRFRPHIERPPVTVPGALVQVDTIHFVDWRTSKRYYVYTLIDLCSRWAYAEYSTTINQVESLGLVLRAQAQAGFRFQMIQTDNGPEFGRWFGDELGYKQIQLRHSRVRQSNDNAHIERFNRTLQDECLGKYPKPVEMPAMLKSYLEYYNNDRRHLGIDKQRPAEVVQSY